MQAYLIANLMYIRIKIKQIRKKIKNQVGVKKFASNQKHFYLSVNVNLIH